MMNPMSQIDDVTIRAPAIADIGAIRRLAGAGIWTMASPTVYTERRFVRRFLKATRAKDHGGAFWVADAGGVAVAAIAADIVHDDVAAVRWLRVAPERRDLRLLLALLHTALEHCRRTGFKQVVLEGQILMLVGAAALLDSGYAAGFAAGVSGPADAGKLKPADSGVTGATGEACSRDALTGESFGSTPSQRKLLGCDDVSPGQQ